MLGSNVLLVKPPILPVLAFNVIGLVPPTVTVSLGPNVSLPEPAPFVMELISVKSPSTLILYGSASVPVPVLVVFLPFSIFANLAFTV